MNKRKLELSSYVPRHLRLGVCCSLPVIDYRHEVKESIPVVDSEGHVIEEHFVLKDVDAFEDMSRYRVEDFRLSALQRAGVPLSMVNVNHSSTFTINELNKICSSIDRSDEFVKMVQARNEEKKSWFKSFDEDTFNVEPLK